MPLSLLSSRLRHSLGSEKKANGCWKLLLLGVPHLGDISLLSVDPLACPHVPSGHFVLLFLSVLSHSDFCFCTKFTLPFQ